jgi:hypothetical protein
MQQLMLLEVFRRTCVPLIVTLHSCMRDNDVIHLKFAKKLIRWLFFVSSRRAWMLAPGQLFGSWFGKLLFILADVLQGVLMIAILRYVKAFLQNTKIGFV